MEKVEAILTTTKDIVKFAANQKKPLFGRRIFRRKKRV